MMHLNYRQGIRQHNTHTITMLKNDKYWRMMRSYWDVCAHIAVHIGYSVTFNALAYCLCVARMHVLFGLYFVSFDLFLRVCWFIFRLFVFCFFRCFLLCGVLKIFFRIVFIFLIFSFCK